MYYPIGGGANRGLAFVVAMQVFFCINCRRRALPVFLRCELALDALGGTVERRHESSMSLRLQVSIQVVSALVDFVAIIASVSYAVC